MTGRGRGMTLPAWMAKDPNATSSIIGSGSEKLGPEALHHEASSYSMDANISLYPDPRQAYGTVMPSLINQSYGAVSAYDTIRAVERPPSPARGREREFRGGAAAYGQQRRTRRSESASRERVRRELRRKKRKERGSNFDVLPEGMDEATANQIAAQAFLQQTLPQAASAVPMTPMLVAPTAAPSMQQTRHARRLYVGNIPRVSEEEVERFFNDILTRALDQPLEGPPVVSVYLNPDRGFAFVELRSVALTTAAMQLDGISYGDIQLKIRRPSDYNAGAVNPDNAVEPLHLNLSALGIVSTTVQDTPNKIFVGGLPYHLTEEQVKELLSAFGTLKSLHLVKEPGASHSKGYAFCEYMDPTCTDVACEGLNGMPLGDKTITMRRAMSTDESMLHQTTASSGMALYRNNGTKELLVDLLQLVSVDDYLAIVYLRETTKKSDPAFLSNEPTYLACFSCGSSHSNCGPKGFYGGIPGAPDSQLAQAMAALDTNSQRAVTESASAANAIRNMQPSRILVLLNMVDDDDLKNDEEYNEILEDVQQECQQYGNLRSVVIPRSNERGVGKVFLEYSANEEAQKAAMSLAGRQFASKIVKAEYYDEQRFAARDL